MGGAVRARRVRPEAVALCWKAREALIEQALGWEACPFLERQRMLLDFRVRAGKPVDEWLEILGQLERELVAGPGGQVHPAPLDRLAAFYDHLGDLGCGHPIEPAWRDHELRDVDSRASDIRRLADLLEAASLAAPPSSAVRPSRVGDLRLGSSGGGASLGARSLAEPRDSMR